MKSFKKILPLSALFYCGISLAQSPFDHPDSTKRGAFGKDTRAEAKSKFEYRDYTRATAVQIEKKNVSGTKVYTNSLGYNVRAFFDFKYNLSPKVRFADQPAAGYCTGFLIAPDILVTAGHCIETKEDLDKFIFVFDYTSDVPYNKSQGYITVPLENQFKGVELLATKLTNDASYDYAVIRLDRKTGRKPYKFRARQWEGVKFEDMLAMIGSPNGIPLKIADSARVINEMPKTYFVTDLDAFHGNSGGPVFNTKGWIEGILVRGPGWDYHYDSTCNCIMPDAQSTEWYEWFGMRSYKGNSVHRINHIPFDLLKGAVYRNLEVAIEENNLEEFTEWATLYSWIFLEKFPGKEPLLIKAVKLNRSAIINAMLDIYNVKINITDENGTPFIHLLVANNDIANVEKAVKNYSFDPDAKNSNGENAFFAAVRNLSSETIIQSLKNAHVDINKMSNWGETPLSVAAAYGVVFTVEGLLRNGADPKQKTADGKTPRKIASKNKNKEVAKILKKAEKGKF